MLELANLDTLRCNDDIADWMELHAFINGETLYSEVESVFEDNRDENESDIAYDAANIENDVNPIYNILAKRDMGLGDLYPFILDTDEIKIKENLEIDSYIYLFCLLISHLRNEGLLSTQAALLTNTVRDLFQVVATDAAVGEVNPNGHAYCSGFPRPEHACFLAMLRTVYSRIGSGIICAQLPQHERYVKDGGIDIIAWSTYQTGGVNHYLLGQVASGDNWDEKPVEANYFHRTFFTSYPAQSEHCIRATFVPFLIGKDYRDSQDDYNSFIRSKEAIHGKIICRERLSSLAGSAINAIADVENKENIIHRYSDFDKIKQWVDNL